MRRIMTAAALLLCAPVLGGCVVALGTTTEMSDGQRIKALEARIAKVEKSLAIEEAKEAKQ